MLKRVLFFIVILQVSVFTWAQSIKITESAGWLESAYIKWQPVESAESYNVYYSGESITNNKIDDQLIRSYGDYYRADLLGLAAGTYTIKVVPVITGVEGTTASTGNLTVLAHDRSGFAFEGGCVPGGYKADGTPKDDAVILYITENSRNKVSLDVTGANENPCVGLETIMEGFAKGKDSRTLIVRLIGNITDFNYMASGDIVIGNNQNRSNYITFEGVGDDAVCNGWGVRVKNATNVEIRNLGSMNCNSTGGDDFALQEGNDHIWIHNCDMFYGNPGPDPDQIKGDGALDTKNSTYCTISYNHFWDSGKSCLLGLSEDSPAGLFMTYHHNWFDHSDSRHPRVRYYSCHVYNNYYDGIAKYGIGSTMGSSVFAECNYFRNSNHPMMTSMQGTDVWNSSTQQNDPGNMSTFSHEDGGTIKAYNNTFDTSIGTNDIRFVAYDDPNPAYNIPGVINSKTDFDAYIAETRDEQVPDTVKSFLGGNIYNNFDTDPTYYVKTSVPDEPDVAKAKVIQYAGRVNGGDFKWSFDYSADDAAYAVNTLLKNAVVGYETKLVSIQGDSAATDVEVGEITPADMIQNFTLSDAKSKFFTFLGNLSSSKGTVTYEGMILTQCLKMESATSITFTTTQSATLTLVFNNDFNGKVKINGVSNTCMAGILTQTIPAGDYTITKGDVANLFYIRVVENTNGIKNPKIAGLSLYPNPVINYLTITSDIEVNKIEIYSVTGILMRNIKSNIKTINMGNLCQGTYLLMIFTEQGIFKQTIIKK